MREGVALWAYAFPLFGIGAAYLLQHRRRFARAWWVALAAITPLSAIALALEWPFSGHILWNIVFLGHNAAHVRSRRWRWVFIASLVHLVAFKAAFQSTRDLIGAPISGALAVVIVVVLRRLDAARVAQPAGA